MTLLQRLKELESKATKGPWYLDDAGLSIWKGAFEGRVADIRGFGCNYPQLENGNLIVSLRNSLPRIIEALEVAMEALEQQASNKKCPVCDHNDEIGIKALTKINELLTEEK